jgi:hypothetical protein
LHTRRRLAPTAAELHRLRALPPSGRAWALSSVKALLDRAKGMGVLAE